MRKLLFFVVLFSSQLFFGQENVAIPETEPKTEDNNQVYSITGIDVPPAFPGGIDAFYNYIIKNYRRPDIDKKGKVFVSFVIEKDGNLTDIKVLRDIGHGTGEEAIRVLKECPKWIPAEQNGKKVRVQYSLPISL